MPVQVEEVLPEIPAEETRVAAPSLDVIPMPVAPALPSVPVRDDGSFDDEGDAVDVLRES